MAFDPDEYLNETGSPSTATTEFDPDAYLSELDSEEETEFNPDTYLEEQPTVAGFRIPKAPPVVERPIKKEEESFIRKAADVPVRFLGGTTGVLKSVADVFGADSPASQDFAERQRFWNSLVSESGKEKDKRAAEIMKSTEDASLWERAKSAGKAFLESPSSMLSTGAGSLAPFIATAGAGQAFKLGAAGVRGLQVAAGAVSGTGAVKGEIYDAVKQAALDAGKSEEEAEALASEAQSYGENPEQIIAGGAIGALAASTGIEATAGRAISGAARKLATGAQIVGKNVAQEVATEVPQEAQVALAKNFALQKAGFDVPTLQGVVEAGTTAGIVAAALGGAAGGIDAVAAASENAQKVKLAVNTQSAAQEVSDIAPLTASVVSDQAEAVGREGARDLQTEADQKIAEITQETPEQRVARLQEEATAAAGIELEEEEVGVEPTVPVTPPVTPTPEGAVAPVEPVVEPVAAEPQPAAETLPETIVRRGEAGVDTNLTVEDKAYRGMTEEEFNNTVLGAGGVESRGDYRFGTEGTNFAEKFEDAESYINFGRDDPRKTGKPTFIVEVDKQPLKINRRGDYEAFEPVSPTKVWKITPKDGELVAVEMQLPQAAPAVTPPVEVAPEVTPTPETPNLEPLRRVARAEQTEDDVSGLVGQGLVELYNGQPVITQAGLEALPEAERPRLNPEARKIQIDTGANEVVAEAIAKNLRIGVDQVGTGVRMPAGWTLVEDIYVPPAPQEVRGVVAGVVGAPTQEAQARNRQLENALDSGDLEAAQSLAESGATMDRETFIRSISPAATQRATTIHTRLERDGIINKEEFSEGRGLVYGDGRGRASTDLGAESYEPFPPSGFTPNYTGDRVAGEGAPIDKKFRTILNTFVLNVVDPETRAFVVKDIANLLENGGRAVFVTRGKDVASSKALVSFGPLERIQRSEGKLTYQKGFTQPELIQYLQETLGDGFEVRALRGGSASDVRVEVVKNTDATLDNPPIVPEARRTVAGTVGEPTLNAYENQQSENRSRLEKEVAAVPAPAWGDTKDKNRSSIMWFRDQWIERWNNVLASAGLSVRPDPRPVDEAGNKWRGISRVTIQPDGQLSVVVGRGTEELALREGDSETQAKQRVALDVEEEVVHAIYISQVLAGWDKQGDAAKYVNRVLSEKTQKIRDTVGDDVFRKLVNDTLRSYYKEIVPPDLINDLTQRVIDGNEAESFTFLNELARMVAQKNVRGITQEEVYYSVVEQVKEWVAELLNSIRQFTTNYNLLGTEFAAEMDGLIKEYQSLVDVISSPEVRREVQGVIPETIPTFSEGSPEASTLSTMAASIAKVDAASEGKPNPENKPTYKISEIASVWMDQGGDARQLQDLISENTNLTPSNAKKVANAIAKQYGLQQQIAETGAVIAEPAPEVEGAPRKTSVQRLIEQAVGVRRPIVRLEVNEKTALKDQIRLKAREARETRKARKEAARDLAEAVTQYVKDNQIRGPVRARQTISLAKQALKLDVNNEKAVDRYIMYVERVVENANYDKDLSDAKALRKRAKQMANNKNIGPEQKKVLEAIGNINPSLLDNPYEYNVLTERYLLGFLPVTSARYSVMPDAEARQYLESLEVQMKNNQAELDRAELERFFESRAGFAQQRGLTMEEAESLLNEDGDISTILNDFNLEKKEATEEMLLNLAQNAQKTLKTYDDTANTARQKQLISFMQKVKLESITSDEKKRFIRFANNVLANGETFGVEQFEAIAKAQMASVEAAKDKRLSKKFAAWISPIAGETATEAAKGLAQYTQSEADTLKNIFGREAVGAFRKLLGLLELDRRQTLATKVKEQIANKVGQFYENLKKKYGEDAVNMEAKTYAAAAGYFIQAEGNKTQEESIAYRRRLWQENIEDLRQSERKSDRDEAELKQKALEALTGNSNAEILNSLKSLNPASYEQLMWWKDEMHPEHKEFLKEHNENFRNQADNYSENDYLSIHYKWKEYVETPSELDAQEYEDPISFRIRQSANSIKRKEHANLPVNPKTNTKANIDVNFGYNQYSALTDQIDRAYTAPAWESVWAFTRVPEFETIVGGRANANFVKNILRNIKATRSKRAMLDDENQIIGGNVALARRLATQATLGGATQPIRQVPDQLFKLFSTSGRWDIIASNIANSVLNYSGVVTNNPLLDKFPISRRGDARAGSQFAAEFNELARKVEASATNKKWTKYKELMNKMGEFWMTPLRASDAWIAKVSWLSYYEAYLNRNNIKMESFEREAELAETDQVRQEAAAQAEYMVDFYAGASDPTKMAALSKQSNNGWREFAKLVFLPLNSFALQQKSALISDARDLMLREGDRKAALAGIVGNVAGMVAFHGIRIYLIGGLIYPAGMAVLKGIFGIDMDEPDEEEQDKQVRDNWRKMKASIYANIVAGGAGQFAEGLSIDAFNKTMYLWDAQINPDEILNKDGEVMSFGQYEKEMSPFYRYRSYASPEYTFGLADVLTEQAQRSVTQTGQLLSDEEMSAYTPNEQAYAYFSTTVEWLYFFKMMDTDATRVARRLKQDMDRQVKEREAELRAIRNR
jgi:hypothetical protein